MEEKEKISRAATSYAKRADPLNQTLEKQADIRMGFIAGFEYCKEETIPDASEPTPQRKSVDNTACEILKEIHIGEHPNKSAYDHDYIKRNYPEQFESITKILAQQHPPITGKTLQECGCNCHKS